MVETKQPEKRVFPLRVSVEDQEKITAKAQEMRESISSYYVKSALMRAGILENDR